MEQSAAEFMNTAGYEAARSTALAAGEDLNTFLKRWCQRLVLKREQDKAKAAALQAAAAATEAAEQVCVFIICDC